MIRNSYLCSKSQKWRVLVYHHLIDAESPASTAWHISNDNSLYRSPHPLSWKLLHKYLDWVGLERGLLSIVWLSYSSHIYEVTIDTFGFSKGKLLMGCPLQTLPLKSLNWYNFICGREAFLCALLWLIVLLIVWDVFSTSHFPSMDST